MSFTRWRQKMSRISLNGLVWKGRQHWLGIDGEPAGGIGWGDLIDLDENEVLPVDKYLERPGTLQGGRAGQLIQPDPVDGLAEALKEAHAPMLAQALLADAFTTPPTRRRRTGYGPS
jgi:hypothetical protein